MNVRRAGSPFSLLASLASFACPLACAFGIAIGEAPAYAADPNTPPLSTDARANKLFTSGEKKFDAGDYNGACADFSESLKLGPKLGTLLNLALCHEMVGKVVTAWSEFSHGAAWAAQNGQKERLEFATSHIRGLEPRLPRIVLQLPGDRPITSLDLDGEPVPEARWFLPLYLDPGEHRLAATAPGKQRTTIAFRVTLSPTDQLVMVPSLQDDVRAIEVSREREVDPSRRRAVGYAALGVGAAGIVTGVVFGVVAATSNTAHAAKTDAAVATATFLGGAAFAAAGGYVLWKTAAICARAALAPNVGGGGFRLSTTF